MDKQQKKSLAKLERLCQRYILKGHSYTSIALQVLQIDERAFRRIRNERDGAPSNSKLLLYINTLEKYLQ